MLTRWAKTTDWGEGEVGEQEDAAEREGRQTERPNRGGKK